MIALDKIEPGVQCTHKNTRLRYTVVEADLNADEILLEAETDGHEPLTIPCTLFRNEFAIGERYGEARRNGGRGRRGAGGGGARPGAPAPDLPAGPKLRGRIKKMVPERGFGFIRGEDGKEVFFHRSGMNGADYDGMNEGDTVEYISQESPRGARAEQVRAVSAA